MTPAAAARGWVRRTVLPALRPLAMPVLRRLDTIASNDERSAVDLKHANASLDTLKAQIHALHAELESLAEHSRALYHRLNTSADEIATELSAVKLMVAKLPWMDDLQASPSPGLGNGAVDDLSDLPALLDQVSEVYQDVVARGTVIRSGLRECASRLEMFLPEIPEQATVLEVGSCFGYFAKGIAQARSGALVVSVEKDRASVAVQRRLLEADGIRNVVLVHGEASLRWVEAMNGACSFFDVVMLLSVIHHLPAATVDQAVREFGKLGKTLIVENPHPDEGRACGRSTMDALAASGDLSGLLPEHTEFRHLGKAASHLQQLERELVVYRDPAFERTADRAYIGDPNRRGTGEKPAFRFRSGHDGWTFQKQGKKAPFLPGVSLWDLREQGPVLWPSPSHLLSQFDTEVQKLGSRSDLRPWNLVYTADGLRIIDTDDPSQPNDPGDVARVRNWLAMIDL